MAASDIKLYNFKDIGRVEASRIILALAGKSYEYVPFTFKEWPEIKPNTPFGQAPFIEIDGKKFGQSLAIAAYLAREFGFYGQSNLDGLKIDMISQLVYEWRVNAAKLLFGGDASNKEEVDKILTEQEAPRYLGYLEKLLKENGSKFMVGESITLGDVVVLDMFTGFVCKYVEEASSNFPLLRELVDRLSNIPSIKNYVASRQ